MSCSPRPPAGPPGWSNELVFLLSAEAAATDALDAAGNAMAEVAAGRCEVSLERLDAMRALDRAGETLLIAIGEAFTADDAGMLTADEVAAVFTGVVEITELLTAWAATPTS